MWGTGHQNGKGRLQDESRGPLESPVGPRRLSGSAQQAGSQHKLGGTPRTLLGWVTEAQMGGHASGNPGRSLETWRSQTWLLGLPGRSSEELADRHGGAEVAFPQNREEEGRKEGGG